MAGPAPSTPPLLPRGPPTLLPVLDCLRPLLHGLGHAVCHATRWNFCFYTPRYTLFTCTFPLAFCFCFACLPRCLFHGSSLLRGSVSLPRCITEWVTGGKDRLVMIHGGMFYELRALLKTGHTRGVWGFLVLFGLGEIYHICLLKCNLFVRGELGVDGVQKNGVSEFTDRDIFVVLFCFWSTCHTLLLLVSFLSPLIFRNMTSHLEAIYGRTVALIF